jgi:hypothetical protein
VRQEFATYISDNVERLDDIDDAIRTLRDRLVTVEALAGVRANGTPRELGA